MRLSTCGTVSPSSLTFLIPSWPTLLISYPTLLLNLSVFNPFFTLGHILPIASLTSTPIVWMVTLLDSGLQLSLIRLTSIALNTQPSATSVSAPLTTLMVVTNELSSYLLILSYPCLPLFFPSIVSSLIVPSLCFSSPLIGSLLFPIRHKAVPPPVYKALC
jgi:hypothetical protein